MQGDGSASSVAPGLRAPQGAHPAEPLPSSILPGGLQTRQGRALDTLVSREAVTRVRPTTSEDLAMLQHRRNAEVHVVDGQGHVLVPDGEGALAVPREIVSGRGGRGDKRGARLSASLDGLPESGLRVDAMTQTAEFVDAGQTVDLGDASLPELQGEAAAPAAGDGATGGDGPASFPLASLTASLASDDSSLEPRRVPRRDAAGAGARPGAGSRRGGVMGSGAAEASAPDAAARGDSGARPWWLGWWPRGKPSAEHGAVDDAAAAPTAAPVQAEAAADVEEVGKQSWLSVLPWVGRKDAAQDAEAAAAADGDGDGSVSSGSGGGDDAPVASDDAADAPAAPRSDGPWWGFLSRAWSRGGAADSDRSGAAGEAADAQAGDGGQTRQPLETVIVSPDLPIEEIAAEIARVKREEQNESDELRRLEKEKLLSGPIERLRQINSALSNLSQPDIALLCALSGGVLVLLAVVAYRLELYVEYERILSDLTR